MKSLILTIARTGDADNTLLSPDTRYVSLCGNNPEVTFSINCKQQQFFNNVKELRYTDGDPSSSEEAIIFFQSLTKKLFTDLKYLKLDNTDSDPLHIRLVTSPLEMAQLPFEFVPMEGNSSNEQIGLLVNPKRMVTLTREVRQESEARYNWPQIPKVLFAWAEPSDSVPHEEHKKILLKALTPLVKPVDSEDNPEPEANFTPFFTELPNASLKSIELAIQKGISDKQPYSHVHILAHGGSIIDLSGITFALILCDGNDPKRPVKTLGNKLATAIASDRNSDIPITVTLSVCDSGNMGNVMAPAGSLALQLHQAGIACVFASQFPLTQPGSITLVKTLYTELINARDPREALYNTRMALKKEDSHDWASLVAFARFPEDIEEQLQVIRLNSLFNTMKTTNAWVDHVLKFKDEIPVEKLEENFNNILKRLEDSIAEFRQLLTESLESKLESAALKSEHLGLLGSAYKRKAEFMFQLIEFNQEKKQDFEQQSADAINTAKDFYQRAFNVDINNHWVAMQYLSLESLIGQSLETKKDLWAFIHYSATWKENRAGESGLLKDQLWAEGTLLELYLLKPLTASLETFSEEYNSSLIKAKNYAVKLKESKNWDIIDSTKRQLDRYISWWPILYPTTFRMELKKMALEIKETLLSLTT